MDTVDELRNKLINNILSIKNRDFLEALDKLITSVAPESDLIELTKEQKIMLEMSERDIENGDLISQEKIMRRSAEHVRKNWDRSFEEMAKKGDDQLLD